MKTQHVYLSLIRSATVPHYPTLDPIYYAPFGNPDAVLQRLASYLTTVYDISMLLL